MNRHYSFADAMIDHADRVLRTLSGHAKTTGRANPADALNDAELTDDEATLSATIDAR
jgi:hypothetical protein